MTVHVEGHQVLAIHYRSNVRPFPSLQPRVRRRVVLTAVHAEHQLAPARAEAESVVALLPTRSEDTLYAGQGLGLDPRRKAEVPR